ncbi:MAG TPA: M24 family metallopeptidase [Candidatus Bilamarchaeum sp.]|nr:M24 family metallopeptidase [Candidatus Bilamarchaeum sp.]
MLLLYRGESFDPNFYYHAGLDIDHCFLIASGRKKTLLTSSLNESLAKARFRGNVVVANDALAELKARLGGKKVQADFFSMSARMASRLRKFCRLGDFSEELRVMRSAKRPDEVRDTARAVKITKEIFASLDFKSAKTEMDLMKQLMHLTIEHGVEPAFEPIVSSDSATAFPHYRAGMRKLGKLVLVDYGVKYNHYCADLTRCFILDADRKRAAEYERLEGVCNSIIDSLPELKKGRDVAKFAGKEMEKRNFPQMIHSIGHGVGLEIHEHPRLGIKSEDKIAGSLLAIEPAFYYPGRYGMRYEETVWFDGKKARIL